MSIFAQQKGNVSKDNVFTVGEHTQQQVERPIEDIQVETRRFFFTVDPRRFNGFPNIDLLNRQQMQQLAAQLPDSVRPKRLYLYRQLVGAANQNPRGPQFSVRGARNGARQIYEVLRENIDYYVDPSQLWIALVRPLNINNERLAVAYEVNVNGHTGVALGRTDPARPSISLEIIIDPSTGLLIGERMVNLVKDGAIPAGTNISWTAVETDVVDSAP